jgi:hypothetical protein
MVDVLKWLARFIPRDPNNTGGFGPFRLPKRALWMNQVFKYHDYYYDIGPKSKMRLSEIDWRIFKALTITAEQPEDWMERCHRAKDICKYWPLMRSFGHYLYNRHGEK